jgi:hypothetical protein
MTATKLLLSFLLTITIVACNSALQAQTVVRSKLTIYPTKALDSIWVALDDFQRLSDGGLAYVPQLRKSAKGRKIKTKFFVVTHTDAALATRPGKGLIQKKHRIKIYKSGLKKEQIKIYAISGHKLLLHLIKLNDKPIYFLKNEYANGIAATKTAEMTFAYNSYLHVKRYKTGRLATQVEFIHFQD